jgi:hypothetical protein
MREGRPHEPHGHLARIGLSAFRSAFRSG